MFSELRLRAFRNLEDLSWAPVPGAQLLLGGNGAGKTSLLEAAYVLATTRSFRTAHIAECTRHGEKAFHLAGEIRGEARIHLEVAWANGERSRSLNGSSSSLAEHLAVQPVVAWTARDAETLTGPPALRRKLLDRGVVGRRPSALEVISTYRRILAQKRQALARRDRGLGSWNELLARAAVELGRLRADYARDLEARLVAVLEESGLPIPAVRLRYRPSLAAARPEEALAQLEQIASQEIERGRPLLGPHRDDLGLRWGGQPLRRVASAGERKALGLALTAAHGRSLTAAGRRPVYVLDDADTELASDTLRSLWKVFQGQGQLFASSNRPEVWKGIPFEGIWRLEGGLLTASSSAI